MIYLDYAATHPLSETARAALQESWQWFANPSSPHRLGRECRERLGQCRAGLRELLGAKKTYDLVFTASATESNNMAILGRQYRPGDEILYSEASHPSLLAPLSQTAATPRPIPLEGGRVTAQSLGRVLSDNSKLLLLEHVSAQTGLICDIEACAQLAGPRIHVHVDAAQSFTKLPLSLQSEHIDSLTLSGHKIAAPRGAAALLAKRYTLEPLIWGGGQEGGLRSGTENLPLIWALWQCARQAMQHGPGHYQQLKSQLIQGLQDLEAVFPFDQQYTADHICSFLYPREPAHSLLPRLEEQGIFLSQAPACSSERAAHQTALAALGPTARDGQYLLRVSLGAPSTAHDIQQFLQALGTPTN